MAAGHVRAPLKWQTDGPLNRVASLAGVAPVHAYGLVTALTGYLMDVRKSGDLRTLSADDLESAAGWTGEPGTFAHAVVNNYVDGRGVILRWAESAEPILREREQNTARVNRFRQKMRESQEAKVDQFIAGGSANGEHPLPSASPSAPLPPASRPPDATRARGVTRYIGCR